MKTRNVLLLTIIILLPIGIAGYISIKSQTVHSQSAQIPVYLSGTVQIPWNSVISSLSVRFQDVFAQNQTVYQAKTWTQEPCKFNGYCIMTGNYEVSIPNDRWYNIYINYGELGSCFGGRFFLMVQTGYVNLVNYNIGC